MLHTARNANLNVESLKKCFRRKYDKQQEALKLYKKAMARLIEFTNAHAHQKASLL